MRATVQLAHSLGARAVGEGVEDEALAGVLRELGCDYGQGYHLGRPMPADDLRALLGMPPPGAAPRPGAASPSRGACARSSSCPADREARPAPRRCTRG